MDLREQNFGIEIEMTGITRAEAAEVLAEYFGTEPMHRGGPYDAYYARDADNRMWNIVGDSSISAQRVSDGRKVMANNNYRVEFVSPICNYDDITTVQELVRALRAKGAFSNKSCGIHVHINATPFEANQLRNLVNIVAAKEDMVYRALQVDSSREHYYCKKIDPNFLEKLNKVKPKDRDTLKNIWYKGRDGSGTHYHDSRYHCLNLHSVFQKNTIEFRAFNGNLHAGKIKAYLQFCMAVTAQAYNQRSASPTKTVSDNEKYTFRVWLLRLGMIGDEFKTARTHLLNHLEGNMAWKSPDQAEAQKERQRAKRDKEREEQRQESPVLERETPQTLMEEMDESEAEERLNEETQEQSYEEAAPAFSMQMSY